MTGANDKYLTTRALDRFDCAKNSLWSLLLGEEHDYKHMTAVARFILGAFVVHIEPDAFTYAGAAVGALILIALLVGCLIPVAYLLEWALRKISSP